MGTPAPSGGLRVRRLRQTAALSGSRAHPHATTWTPLARFGSQYALDAAAWGLALTSAALLRYDLDLAAIAWIPLLAVVVASGVIQLLTGWHFHLYRGRYVYGTFEEVRALAGSILGTAMILAVPVLVVGPDLQLARSIPFIALPIALALASTVRYSKRLFVERRRRPTDAAVPTLILGAGELGGALVTQLRSDPYAEHRAVGLLDDDPGKRARYVRRVPVLGGLDDLSEAVAATGASVLVVAVARADARMLQRVHEAARLHDLRVKVFPPLSEILAQRSGTIDIRDMQIEDLIGRRPVDMKDELVTSYITGRRVLVTGAGGSIGTELCRQIAAFAPAELTMLDRDETGLQAAQLAVSGHGLLDTRDVVLADIRDAAAVRSVFVDRQPEVVFHAAALKHLPMLEQYPDEAWKTNVQGTLHVLRAAEAVAVTHFVNISTDKAANPSSVLGRSKRLAERLTAWSGAETGRSYLSVRFGNVLGSRGSLVPTFTELLHQGRPLTVTHPDATRFFMTVSEACQLVVQAGGVGTAGEVLILDMGQPVRILDIARKMMEMSGRTVDIVFTGLREGEKIAEELVGEGELPVRPHHAKIQHARVPSLSPAQLDRDVWLTDQSRQTVADAAATQVGAG